MDPRIAPSSPCAPHRTEHNAEGRYRSHRLGHSRHRFVDVADVTEGRYRSHRLGHSLHRFVDVADVTEGRYRSHRLGHSLHRFVDVADVSIVSVVWRNLMWFLTGLCA